MFRQVYFKKTELARAVASYCYNKDEKQLKIIKSLIESNANIALGIIIKETTIITPLHDAVCYTENSELIELLINNETINKACTSYGYTPLMAAVLLREKPNLNIIKLLLEKGAKVGQKSNEYGLSKNALTMAKEAHPENTQLITLLEQALDKEEGRYTTINESSEEQEKEQSDNPDNEELTNLLTNNTNSRANSPSFYISSNKVAKKDLCEYCKCNML